MVKSQTYNKFSRNDKNDVSIIPGSLCKSEKTILFLKKQVPLY